MSDRVFLDSNIIVYAYSVSDPRKQKIAENIILNNTCVVSTQVMNEYSNVCLKKYSVPVARILLDIDEIDKNCNLVKIDEATIKKALILKDIYGYSYYDCLVLSSALENKCNILYSEDMQDEQVIENTLKITNPF